MSPKGPSARLAVALLCVAALGVASTGVFAQGPAFALTSTAFLDGDDIPVTYTCNGSDFSPPLFMANVPAGTAVLAFSVVDVSAGNFVHWIFWDLPPASNSLAGNEDVAFLGAIEGNNDFGQLGYGGPCPPCGTHTYRFTAFALDAPLGLASGSDMPTMAAALAGVTILAQDDLDGTFMTCAVVGLPAPPPPPPPPPGTTGPDSDQDGIADSSDNCISLPNHDQEDLDGDAVGDVCDDDVDGDGIKDADDICPVNADPGQEDQDGDGSGDACQEKGPPGTTPATARDVDGDLVPDAFDNCATLANNDQADLDHDRLGDMCDVDADGDGVLDSGLAPPFVDNCPTKPNHDQTDSDGDGAGNICDATPNAPVCTSCSVPPPATQTSGETGPAFPWEMLGGGLLIGALVGIVAAAVLLRKPAHK